MLIAGGTRLGQSRRNEEVFVVVHSIQKIIRAGDQNLVLGAGGTEGLAIEGAGLGIDGIEGDELDVEQGMDERAMFGFEGDGNGAAAEALTQVGFFDGGVTLDLEGQGVSLIAPIEAEEGSVVSHDDSSWCFLVTGALLDRLTHRVHILEANGPSYRLAQAKQRMKRK